jgi:fatty-acyl-CoA synthase
MLEGLMQDDHPLTVRHVLERVRRFGADSEIVTLTDRGERRRTPYASVAARADRLAAALAGLGVRRGDRVATFMWNDQEHFELYLAVPSMGAVLHTVNIRLHGRQVAYVLEHAASRVLVVDDSLAGTLATAGPLPRTVEHVVVVGRGEAPELPGAIRYEELLAGADATFDYPRLDERTAAGLCYTSGTTGDPKGVLYSHRSTVLHAMAQCSVDALGLHSRDRALPVVPMFHVNAWGIPYGCGLCGASLVMPGRFLAADALAALIEAERVTVSAGVPTIWWQLLEHLDREAVDTSSVRLLLGGGVHVPRALMQAFEERHGVRMVQGWGMTETSPVCAVAHPPAGASGEAAWSYRGTGGRLLPFVEARVVGDDGAVQPWDGTSQGELEVRGPWVARGYYRDPTPGARFRDGWLRTGDIASIDARGYVRIADRAKDVIKSGGEWISSVALEEALLAHEAVRDVAVIARPDEKWSERPLACVVLADGPPPTPEDLQRHLAGRVAKWWIPEAFSFIGELPRTGTGKPDKKLLRSRLAKGELRVVAARPSARAPAAR